MNEYWVQMLKMWEAQQAWSDVVWKDMQACPWLFYPINDSLSHPKDIMRQSNG